MSTKKNQRVLNGGLEEVLMQCREAAENALHTTAPRAQVLRDVLAEYRQAVEKIDTGTLKSDSDSVRTTAKIFAGKLRDVKEVLLHLAEEAGKELDNSLDALRKNEGFVTIAFFGQTRAGKSTTLEALTGGDGETIGVGRQHTTTQIEEYFWPPDQKMLRIVDTPGIEGLKGEELAAQAQDFVELADHLFFLISDDKVRPGELEELANIRSMGKGTTVLLNIKKSDEDLIEDLIEDRDFLFDDLFDDSKIAEHTQRIVEYLERNHGISKPTILPIHARAAWLATQPEYKSLTEDLHKLSRIDSVEKQIRKFIKTKALGARIESPRQATRSHVVSIKANLRIFAGQFRHAKIQTDKQCKALKEAVKNAAWKARSRLSEMKMPFQRADDRILSLVDGLIVDQGGGKKLRSEWNKILKSSGVEDAHQKFIEDTEKFFTEELNEQVHRFKFDAKFDPYLGEAQSEFEKVDDYHKNKKYRRAGRAGVKVVGGFAGGALMTWAVGNFWNPTGWLAGVGAVVLFGAGAFAGGKVAGEVADEWSKSNQKTLRKHRNDIVNKLKKGLWAQYKQTNDACFDELSQFEVKLLKDIQEPLRQISHAQKQLWRAAVNGLETLDRLEDDLELDVVAKFAELVVPEIASGDIELVRAVRWEGYYTKLLVAPTRPLNNVLGRCIGRGGERVKKLKDLLGGEHVAWVEAGVDFRTQIGQALSPAQIEVLDIEITSADEPISVVVSSSQIKSAIGPYGANVKMAARLLQANRIDIKQLEKK